MAKSVAFSFQRDELTHNVLWKEDMNNKGQYEP